MLHYNQRNFRKAQNYFARAIFLDSNNEKYYLGMAASSYYLGELDRALVYVNKVQELESENSEGIALGSMVYAALGSFENASLVASDAFTEAGGAEKRQSTWARVCVIGKIFMTQMKLSSNPNFVF